MDDTFMSGLNSEQGGNAYALARLVAFDPDGRRAALVLPHLQSLASAPNPGLRACVAALIQEMLRWHPDAATTAFGTLARDRQPELVTTRQFEELTVSVILTEVDAALPVLEDLLKSEDAAVRECGSRLATFAAIEVEGRVEQLERVLDTDDVPVRRGAARVLAARVRWMNQPAAREALSRCFNDPEGSVREAASSFIGNLRGKSLADQRELIATFIGSPAVASDPTQLLLTLEYSPVPEHHLVLQIAGRILDAHGTELADVSTRAAGDAHHLTEIVLRSYTTAEDATLRSQLLDYLDRLLELGAYGVADAIEKAGR